MPVGFSRPYKAGGVQAQSLGAFHKDAGWHVAFHGTRVESLKGILSANALAKPGDEVVVGKDETMKLSIREDTGRIRREQRRENRHTRRAELFDPNQVFMSPTVRYCERSGYAKPTRWQDPEDMTEHRAQVCFQLRVMPGSYAVGQETIAAGEEQIDPAYSNDEIEWYTTGDAKGSMILTGLLVRIGPSR